MKDFFAQVYSPEAYLSDLASPKCGAVERRAR